MMRTTVLGIVGVLAVSPALADAMKIKFASPSPPKAHLNVQVFAPWTKEVSEGSSGTLQVELVAGHILASHRNVFDRVRQNVAQIGWGLQGLVPGQFPRSNVVEVPGVFDTSTESSIAFWRLLEKGLLGDEYKDVKPLAIFSFPPNSIHAREPIATIDDLKGKKFAVAGKLRGEMIAALGGVPISLAPPEYYQSVNRGLVAGFLIPWTGVPPYRLNEVSKFTIDGPLGGSAGMIFMNKSAYAKLPAEARRSVDERSGEVLVRRFSAFWDRIQEGSRKRLGFAKGHKTVAPKGAEKERMIQMLAAVEKAWVGRTPGGDNLMQAFRAEVEKVRSGS